jgi:hypothetical protein
MVILVGVVVAASMAFRAINVLTRRGFRQGRERLTFRYLAMLIWSAAIAAYIWGSLHLLLDETAADAACKTAVGPEHAGHVSSYDISYFPLHFGCRVTGVGTFEGAVPGYLNPTVVALLLVAIALSIMTGFASNRPATTPAGRGRGSTHGAAGR